MTVPPSDADQNNDGPDIASPSANPESDVAMENEPQIDIVNDNNGTSTQQQQVRISHVSNETFHIPASDVERRPDTIKCRFLPHGIYAVVPALFSTFAWLSSLTQDGCDYARLTGPIVTELTNDPQIPFLDVGFNQFRSPELDPITSQWVVDYRLPCQDYNTDVVEMDAFWKVSKGTAFLSLVFGGGGALFLWFSSCFVFSRGTWRWAGYELLAATICQALSFLWFKTSLCHGSEGMDNCSLYYGSKTDILACCFWGVSVLAIFGKYPMATNKSLNAPDRGGGSSVPTEVEMTEQDLPLEGHATTIVTGATDEDGAPRNQANDFEII